MALCLEINVCSQGDSIEDARRMLHEACDEYLAYMKDEGLEREIKTVPLDVLRDFLMDDVECVRPSSEWVYSESITFEVCASVQENPTDVKSEVRQASVPMWCQICSAKRNQPRHL